MIWQIIIWQRDSQNLPDSKITCSGNSLRWRHHSSRMSQRVAMWSILTRSSWIYRLQTQWIINHCLYITLTYLWSKCDKISDFFHIFGHFVFFQGDTSPNKEAFHHFPREPPRRFTVQNRGMHPIHRGGELRSSGWSAPPRCEPFRGGRWNFTGWKNPRSYWNWSLLE